MSTLSYSKNNKYFELSKRTYLEDYGRCRSRKIDMTLSGTYLYKYPFKNIENYRLDKYPSIVETQELITNIKNKFSFNKKNFSVIIGPGSNGLIQNICKVLLKKNDNMLTPYLSFGQAEFAATSFGAVTKRVYLDDFNINLDYFEKCIDSKTKMIYICNPNNPTGLILKNSKILEFAKKHPQVYIVVDESTMEFANLGSIFSNKLVENIIVLKSFSKAYGLANLRIGYIVCSKEFEERYVQNVTTNEYSGISCVYANEALLSNYYLKNVEKTKKEIEYLRNNLQKIGIETFETYANTIFTKTVFKDEAINILKKHDISLVNIYDSDNKLHFRIACQTHETNKIFIEELKKIDNIKKYII